MMHKALMKSLENKHLNPAEGPPAILIGGKSLTP